MTDQIGCVPGHPHPGQSCVILDKTCKGCWRTLPLDCFGRVRSDRPWLRSKCRDCENERLRNQRKEARRG